MFCMDLAPWFLSLTLSVAVFSFSRWAEDNQTGLSDTAELLDGLVKEGYISLTDLDLSSSPTPAHNSRYGT